MDDQYDDEYDDDDYHDYDHPSLNPNQWYFSFDVSNNSGLSKWLVDMLSNLKWTSDSDINIFDINNIPGFPVKKFPVNSWNPNTGGTKKPQYLGSNYYGEQIWKSKYFVSDPINQEYKNHLQHNAAHFIRQPKYYKGMFDILN